MLGQKRRFFILAFLMVILVAIISAFGARLMYQTSLQEQELRLLELVESQASLSTELEHVALEQNEPDHLQAMLIHLSRAHKQFKKQGTSGEFIVGRSHGSDIQLLLMNGKEITKDNQFAIIPQKSPYAAPMKRAILGESGVMTGLDYKGREVLAAYTPLFLQDEALGLVAKIDIENIRAPFIQANLKVFGVGLVLTLLGLFIFYKLSEPIIRDIHFSEKKYRNLVEWADSLILRVD